MEEDGEVDIAPQRVCRLPEAVIGRRRRGGRGGQGHSRGRRRGSRRTGWGRRRSSSQAHARTPVDLNEPASGLYSDFSFALGGTLPSAFFDVPTHMDADDQAPPAAEAPEPRRGRRPIRRRGCGTGGHM
ncbi:hypothetical protein PIB30_045062 [Stylosanthes scabra]|uniref:Uncharacterized protein n=1 Tax=Stylosanthes scabra TaxID=79078 RepID=A0ABU6UI47_9FABA|nr:hypothetical protein [Stylosanthes scabra]